MDIISYIRKGLLAIIRQPSSIKEKRFLVENTVVVVIKLLSQISFEQENYETCDIFA